MGTRMRCHYEKVKGVGRVLIPGCMAVAVSGDIERCTCQPTTFEQFESRRYQKELKRLRGIIEDLEKENEYYAGLMKTATFEGKGYEKDID